jgi:transcriptional regulator with XRE-family HTH domain
MKSENKLQLSKEEFAEKIGQNMRKYRDDRGLTLREMGERTDYTGGYIGLLEKGNAVPNTYVLMQISKALNVPVSKLLSEDTSPIPESLNDPIFQKEESKPYIQLIKEIMSKGIEPDKVREIISFYEKMKSE